ncbi:hypothetical protein [Sorangium sp. So ce131]|uniref:hypothetical protein n=1 Tax=Sorangium sp. So ce131 TaxID=3133282 RepID=UPI003F61152B
MTLGINQVLPIFEALAAQGGTLQDVKIGKFGALLTRELRGANRGQWKSHGLVEPKEARVWAADYFTFFA